MDESETARSGQFIFLVSVPWCLQLYLHLADVIPLVTVDLQCLSVPTVRNRKLLNNMFVSLIKESTKRSVEVVKYTRHGRSVKVFLYICSGLVYHYIFK